MFIEQRSLSAFFLMIVIFLAGCSDKKKDPPAKAKPAPAPVVDVIIAKPTRVSNIVEANGTVLANESVELHPESTGKLIYLNIPEGRHVTKGTVLAQVNDADLRAQISKSQVQLDLAQKTLDRLKQLLDVNGVNQADYDAALSKVHDIAWSLYGRGLAKQRKGLKEEGAADIAAAVKIDEKLPARAKKLGITS